MLVAPHFTGEPVSSNKTKMISDADREKLRKELEKNEDGIVKNNISTRAKIAVDKTMKLPIYAVRGMKGDRNASFYEFLEMGKIPFVVGGASMIYAFCSGISKEKQHEAFMASKVAKRAAMGVILYAVGKSIANAVVNAPVKAFTGIDVNLPYRRVVKLQQLSNDQQEKTRVEYHKAYESVDFPRWDLLDKYNLETKDGEVKYYDKIAKKLGCDDELNESGQAVKPKIKETVIRARTWETLLTIPLAACAVGLASQDAWGDMHVMDSIKNTPKALKKAFSKTGLFSGHPVQEIKYQTQHSTLGKSIKQMWTGNGSKLRGTVGKSFILAALISPLIAATSTVVSAKIRKKPEAKSDFYKKNNYSES